MVTLFLVRKTDDTPDYAKALGLVAGDIDAENCVGELVEALRDGTLNAEDGSRVNGEDYVFEYHHGQGDGGSQTIANIGWIEADFPEAFKALAIEYREI